MQQTDMSIGENTDLGVIDQFLTLSGLFIVEVGCGAMELSKEMANRGAHVLGIDPDAVQAQKNQAAPPFPNVGFACVGADAIPVESQSVDGMMFPYSLHHIPHTLYPRVIDEVNRVLKPDGFVYVIEPVASGPLNEVMRLFHDEFDVRQHAQRALDIQFKPLFNQVVQIDYYLPIAYASFEEFAEKYANKSYNTQYTEDDVRHEQVRRRFLELGQPINFEFQAPMRVTLMKEPFSRPLR